MLDVIHAFEKACGHPLKYEIAARRAGDLAMAMEARCYRGDIGRTRMKPLKYKKADFISYIVIFVTMILVIAFGRNLGWIYG